MEYCCLFVCQFVRPRAKSGFLLFCINLGMDRAGGGEWGLGNRGLLPGNHWGGYEATGGEGTRHTGTTDPALLYKKL